MGGAGEIAIVGMACVMPGAPDVETFWGNIVDGVDSVSEVPPSRWVTARHYDPHYEPGRDADEPMSISKWGGFVPEVGFDALAWGIPPASLASIDPAQLLALKAATGALEDAGYGTGEGHRPFPREHTSVVYATGSGGASELPAGFMLRLLLRSHGITAADLPPELAAHLPQLTEDGLPGVLTSVIAGRVANRLDLGGKNLVVDSACASVLVALDIARNELLGGSSDMVLCGGVDLHNGVVDYVSFTAAQALSRSGRCRAFDVDADGMTLAEGCGCLVLKRLEDAVADGDRVYAVVRGVAGSSDGRHLGLTAPRQEGQERAVRRAYHGTGISPTEIGLVEAHGTGTPTGDRTELATTTAVFAEAGVAPGSVVMGSVKSNIGHIKCAAGMAALIKTAKALYHGVLAPTLHIRTPIEEWDPATSPFVFRDQARPWLAERRMAAVSSFGFGGTNFHAILEAPAAGAPADSAEPSASGRPHWPSELVAVRAPDDAALATRLEALAGRLADELEPPRQADRWRLRDVAAAETRAGDGPVRLVLVADDLDDLAAKVDAARAGGAPTEGVYPAVDLGADGDDPPGVAFLFADDATAARPGMGADLAVAFPAARAALVGTDPAVLDAMWPGQAFAVVADAQRAALAAVAPAALEAAATIGAAALRALGVTPDRLAGRVPGGAGGAAVAVDADGLRALADEGVRVFVEVGPGDALTRRVGAALGDVPHLAVATDVAGRHGLTTFLHAVAQLLAAGVDVDLDALFAGRDARPDRWDDPPRKPLWMVNGHYARAASGASLPKGLHPADEAPLLAFANGSGNGNGSAAASGAPAAGGADGDGAPAPERASGLSDLDLAVVTEYLKIVQGTIATGSEIIRHEAGRR
ncbi:MAG TPA: beta-ketoacyl synthase N-terminal-like domain-containing protein [Acidimicrobiales bacterium]